MNLREAIVEGVPKATSCGTGFLTELPLVGGGVCMWEESKDMAAA